MRIVHCIRLLLFALVMLAMPVASFAQVNISVNFAPPELPVYDQPPCPDEGYIWTPGYWAWDGDDYYWVPGTWVMAPEVGLLWTPGYWGWGGDSFVFYEGYWGPHVGFYGGVSYGFGYFGHGYEGGRWDNGRFFYNRSVNNVNETVIHNVYNTTVINNNTNVTRVSYNGGNGGVNERPTREEETATHERHVPPPAAQMQHVQAARSNPQLKASVNQGKPPVAATPKPAAFNDRAVVPAKEGGRYNPPPNRGANITPRAQNGPNSPAQNNPSRPANVVHPNDLPPVRPSTPSTGNPKQDQRYQQQQETLIQQQNQQRQQLQQRQEQEHQRLDQQKANDARKQQVEQRHQQQTQQLQHQHATQQQKLQDKQQPSQRKPPG
jgi:hypothetical protein